MSDRQINDTTRSLIQAKRLIEDEGNWCQFYEVLDHHDGTRKYCAFGAVYSTTNIAINSGPVIILDRTAWEMGHTSTTALNDFTDHSTVMRLFDQAIAKSIQEGAR